MHWHDAPIDLDGNGEPMFKARIVLQNDKQEFLASVLWFYDQGPFYAHAMDAKDVTLVRRIGPCTTLEGAKQACIDAIEGRLDISQRAGYVRSVQS